MIAGRNAVIMLSLMLLCIGGCFRSAPPLEDDEETVQESPTTPIAESTPETSGTKDISAPDSGTDWISTPVPDASASPIPTPEATPQRPNNLPLIMQIADQTANEYSQISPIGFRIFDFDDVVRCQDVVPSSSDVNIVNISPTATVSGGSRIYNDVTMTGGESTECGIAIKTNYARSVPAIITLTLKDPSVTSLESKSTFKVTVISTNSAPYINSSAASSVSVIEDSSTPAVFALPSFSDSTQRQNHTLNYAVTSAPLLGILSWPSNFPNSTGTASYLPSKNKNGLDSFTYIVCDNDPGIVKCTDPQTVLINVQPENDPPTMNAIPDQTTSEAVSKFFEFMVDDIDGPLECKAANLNYSVSIQAGDTADLLDPAGAVVWGGTWPLCSATLTPKPLKSGTIHVTLSLNDGNPLSTAQQTFKLTVLGSNHAPTIATNIENKTVSEDSAIAINFTVEDIDYTPATASDYTCTSARLSYTSGNTAIVASSARVSWSGTWPACTGTIYPNANANGTVNMTFSITDPGGLSASKTFQLTVSPQNDPPTGTVICDANSTTDIVKAGRSGNWTLNCTGASDVDNETPIYSLIRDSGSPFNNSASFTCPSFLTGANISQAFSTAEYGTCKYKARACDAAGLCTADTAKVIEITSYQLNMNSLSKPNLSSACMISSTVNFDVSANISNLLYSATVGMTGVASSTGARTISSSSNIFSFSAQVPSGYQISNPPTKDTAPTSTTAVFSITSGTFSTGTQGGSATGNLITSSSVSSYYIERKLEKLTVKPLGSFTVNNVALDGYQTEFVTTDSVCRLCNSGSYASMSAGALHTCLIDNGVSKCWGHNNGQLGLSNPSSPTSYTYPVSSTTVSGFSPIQIAAGKDFSCVLGSNSGVNEVRCAGSNTNGQLGISASQNTFTNKATLPSGQTPIGVSVSKTGGHSCAITNQTSPSVNGKIFCWGLNDFGQLGTGNTTSSGSAGTVYALSQGALTGQNGEIFSVATGKSHTCAVQYQSPSGTSQVYCWGRNSAGQLGLGHAIDSSIPSSIALNEDIVQVSAGDYHSCALTKLGELYCWGDNSVGQLGIGSVLSKTTPIKISSLNKIVQVTAGSNHTCALTEDSLVYCWGLGTSGQLGVGKVTTTDQTAGEDCNPNTGVANITFCKQTPAPIDPAPTTTPVTITAGENHTCMMTIEGNVYCWGANTDGQLGTANKSQVSSPAAVCSSSSQCSASGQLTTPRPRMCSRYSIP